MFDFVGTDATMEIAIGMARAGGHVAVVGLAGGRLHVGFGARPFRDEDRDPYWGTQAELIEVLALRASDRIGPHIERSSLHDIDDAYRRNARETLEGRAVVTPGA